MVKSAQQTMNMREMSIGQRVDMVANILSYPALTVTIFVRRRAGYRTLKPFQIVLMFLLMQTVPTLFGQQCYILNGYCKPGPEVSDAFYCFTWVFLIGGFVQRFLRWRELAAGKAWHTYSRGVSYFEFLTRIRLPIPGCRRVSLSFVYRVVDAAVVAAIAMAIGGIPALHGLAQWLFFSALCMMFVENYVHDKQLDRELDLLDSLVDGETHARLAQRYGDAPQGQVGAPGLWETAGIPTGIGPDIVRQVEARRATGHGVAPGTALTR